MPAIAVVGSACIFPDAASPGALWENVLARRRAFRRIPRERLDLADYWAADPAVPDAIYATEAAVIEGYAFDRVRFSVPGNAFRAADMAHWLALDVAGRAFADAGFADGAGLPAETTGVLLGNTLTGEFSRASQLRLRWPYVRRQVEAQLAALGWDADRRRAFLEQLEPAYKAPFAPVGEESLAGGLSNTIAGRICNHWGLHGGGYTVDGACSSSLLAVAQACQALELGDLDVALAGGVDLSLDPFELVGFSKTGALAKGSMRVYDRDSAGFLPGEGCGFVVLMRLDDALALGRAPQAVVRGWGISSDGGGGITRPEVHGQRLALDRAWRRAGRGLDGVPLFEGHGTGTAVGDEVELRTLVAALREAETRAPAAVGSVKANIGHTKAAAGVAGLLKAVSALRTQMLPPNTGMFRPHPVLTESGDVLRVLRDGEIWPAGRPLLAGVSSFGFGGINVHVALEGASALRRGPATAYERRLLATYQDTELFLLAAADRGALRAQVEQLRALAARLAHAELSDLAAALAQACGPGPLRAAVSAATPGELAERLGMLDEQLQRGVPRFIGRGVCLGEAGAPARLAFLFPGQASPVRFGGGAWASRFAAVDELYAAARLERGDPRDTAVAQPAIVAAELAGLRVLRRLGLAAQWVVGHSLGELTALHAAGAFDEAALLRIARARGRLMERSPAGAMASLEGDAAEVQEWLAEGAAVAGLNSPRQTVVAGTPAAVEKLLYRARQAGRNATRLPVAHAFHHPLMQAAAGEFARALAQEPMQPPAGRICSTVRGRAPAEDEDLRTLLTDQLTRPVRFQEAAELALADADMAIEVGPGEVLAGLARELTGIPVFALDAGGASLGGLMEALAAAHALGVELDRQALFADRFTRPFDPQRPLTFFANPCEAAPRVGEGTLRPDAGLQAVREREPALPPSPAVAAEQPAVADAGGTDILEGVRKLVAARAELPLDAVSADARLLADLHLNSISVGQLVAEASRQLGMAPPAAPTDYATATVGGVAQALRELLETGGLREAEGPPAGVDAWVRGFRQVWEERPLRPRPAQPAGAGEWRVLAAEGHPLAAALAEGLAAAGGRGVAVCLPAEPGGDDARRLLEAARSALAGKTRFLLVDCGSGSAAFAKTLHLESGLDVTVADVPEDPRAAQWIIAELASASGFREVRYDAQGRRFEPVMELLPLAEGTPAALGPEDVLLVSGGGKGIAAESAAALALETGARLALLGRSRPEDDPVLAQNLERLAAKGIRARYYACDVGDAAAVKAGVGRAEGELGPVTALLHGAGVNRPCLLAELTEAQLEETLAAKTGGLANLLAAVQPDRLRLLVSFSSVIGVAGLRGEADYALANGWLSRMTRRFAAEHPACRAVAIEWSIWSGVGMGERLGRVDALLREGITPIPVAEGIAMLRRLVGQPLPEASVVVSGRLGDLPTLRWRRPELPFLRFLERPRVFYPGVELVAEAELSAETDPYLADHVFHGERLLAAVMGMEAMAQAACALTGAAGPPALEDVVLLRPVVINDRATLRLAALVRDPGRVEVVLRSSETGYAVDHFRALCNFDAPPAQPGPIELPAPSLALDPQCELYGGLLFQSGRFRRLTGYRELSATRCIADVAPGEQAWFGAYLPDGLLLGDPGVRDACIHAIQACIPHGLLLPTGIERWQAVAGCAPGPRVVRAEERWRRGDAFCYDLEVADAAGNLCERWQGLQLRRVAELPTADLPPALLAPYLERRLGELGVDPVPRVTVVMGGQREARGDAGMARAAGGAVVHRPDGRPEALNGAQVSAAHAGELTLALAADRPVACDLEAVAGRDDDTWQGVLGKTGWALALTLAHEADETRDMAATRVWCARECLKKLGAAVDAPLVSEGAQGGGWWCLSSGRVVLHSWVGRVGGAAAPLALVVALAPPAAARLQLHAVQGVAHGGV